MTKEVSWQPLYQAALLELDPRELWKRIGHAEAAIHQRITEIRERGPGFHEEAESLQAALRGLRALAEKECQPQLLARSATAQDKATS